MSGIKEIETFRHLLDCLEQFEEQEEMTREERKLLQHWASLRLGSSLECFLAETHCFHIAELTEQEPIRTFLLQWIQNNPRKPERGN